MCGHEELAHEKVPMNDTLHLSRERNRPSPNTRADLRVEKHLCVGSLLRGRREVEDRRGEGEGTRGKGVRVEEGRVLREGEVEGRRGLKGRLRVGGGGGEEKGVKGQKGKGNEK